MSMGALTGIKVVEMASYITGPFTSMLLADLGASVTKIEMPGYGDPFRGWGERAYNPTFCAFNRNKRSLSLNVAEPEGREIFMRLARDADVVIENMRPGVTERMGISYDVLRVINPRLVYCSISGYGPDGPYRDRPGYDTIGQAMGGLLGVLTDPDNPGGVGAPLSDLVTGLFACYAIQGALIGRGRTGLGQKVETSLLQATVAFGTSNAATYLASGKAPTRETRTRMAQVYVFSAGDGLPFVVHLSSPQKFWEGLTAAIDRPDLRADPRFAAREGRLKNYDELRTILRDIFRGGPREKWLRLLESHDVPVAPILDLKEVFDDPQVAHLGMLVEMKHPKLGPVRLAGSGIRMSETPPRMHLPPPALGEHNAEILGALGYGDSVLELLKSKGII